MMAPQPGQAAAVAAAGAALNAQQMQQIIQQQLMANPQQLQQLLQQQQNLVLQHQVSSSCKIIFAKVDIYVVVRNPKVGF